MSYEFPSHESTRKRRRWGCTCGCVILLIIFIILGGFASWFGLKPHEEFQRFALMDGEVDGFGVLRINPEDDGVQEFTQYVLKRLETASKANPEGTAQAKAINIISKLFKTVLSQFFQPETMIYSTYNPVTADENFVMSAPLKNRVAWFLLQQALKEKLEMKPAGRDGAAEIFALKVTDETTSTLMSLDPNEMMISDNDALLRKSLKYSRDTARDATPSENLQFLIDELALDEPPVGEDLAWALLNEESRITNLIYVFEDVLGIDGISERVAAALSAQKLSFADITGIKITADLATADMVKMVLTLYCPNQDTAGKLSKVFETTLPHLTGKNASSAFELDGKATSRGSTVVVTLDITGLKKWVQNLIPVTAEEKSEAAEPATPAPAPAGATPALATPQS